MKAAFISQQEDARVLEYGDSAKPVPKAGEVLIRVKACALNHIDLHVLKGRYNVPLPHTGGCDVAGEVVEINGPSRLSAGQSVVVNPAIACGQCLRCAAGSDCENVAIFGFHMPGGLAEYVTVPTSQVYAMPKNLSYEEAAAFPLTFLTAWHMLLGRAKLLKDETVFIWGASGGLGSAATAIAKHVGARVIAAAGNDEDAAKIKTLGADEAVIYTQENVANEVMKLNGGIGVDVVFESIGAKTWATTLAMLRPYGRVVIAGTTSGAMASQDLSDVYYYQQTILGSRMGTPAEFEQVLKLVESGALKPVVDSVINLNDTAGAMKRLEQSRQVGKIVINVGLS